MKKTIKTIGILTGGGDCPGLNAVIRAVVKKAINDYKLKVIGIKNGYVGLLDKYKHLELFYDDVSGILAHGGTILGTDNKTNPFKYPVDKRKGKLVYDDISSKALQNFRDLELDAVICAGGDGTLTIASKLHKRGLPIIGIPKTIDNDVVGTEVTFGFNSSVVTATEGIDKLHTTAQSHHRVMVIEVMGRYTGWLALYSGVAGGADVILIPELPFDINKVCETVKSRYHRGKRFSIVVVAEGTYPKGGKIIIKRLIKNSPEPIRLGGIGERIAKQIEDITGIEARVVVMGHLLRGGVPSALDRVLATRFGTEAVNQVMKENFGTMVALKNDQIISVKLSDIAGKIKKIQKDNHLIISGRSVSTFFGN